MKVYTDCLRMSFFKTDKHIKNLKKIEINTVKDFVGTLSLDPLILLGINNWMVGRFDELTSGNPTVDLSDEPELHGEWLEIDFIKGTSNLDILVEISEYWAFGEREMELMLPAFEIEAGDRVGVADLKRWIIKSGGDGRRLEVIVTQIDLVYLRFLKEGEA